MSQQVSERLDNLLRRAVETESIPGAIVLLRQHDRVVHHAAYGVNDRQSRVTLQPDSVVWLASMTKPIVAAAILMLREEGKLRLQDPLSRFIPEFALPRMVRVWRAPEGKPSGTLPAVAPSAQPQDDPPHDLVPASREITLFDLLTHTSGLQTITIPNRAVPVTVPGDTLATRIPKLASVPLDFQPGTQWAYSNAVGFDVLGRIVEIVSGVELPAFLEQRVFTPLGMRDTGFGLLDSHPRAVPADPRFAVSPAMAGKGYHSGAAGLWGTLADYGAFAEMLRHGGKLNGVRLLMPQSVEQLTCNQVAALFPGLNGRRAADGFGFGLSVACILDPQRAGVGLPAGSFGWDGVGTRRFWVCPQGELVLTMHVPHIGVQAEVEQLCGELTVNGLSSR